MFVHGTFDFETASEAGYCWNEARRKWDGPPNAPQGKKGLQVIGSGPYSEHPSTRVLTLSFKLPGDVAVTRWRPGQPLPQRLFDYLAAGGILEAHNAMFERMIWVNVCMRLYGFPPINPAQLHCSMATAHVNSLPGGLGRLADVLKLPVRKNADGRRLLNKFSVPRNPTKNDPRTWVYPEEDPIDAEFLYSYCDDDVIAEEAASAAMPPMTDDEREMWLFDQEINWRGLAIDRKGVDDCAAVLNQALDRYGEELETLTGGVKPTELERLKGWLAAQHVYVNSLDADHVEALLKKLAPHPPGGIFPARRAIELRALVGSASVKKIFAMQRMASNDNRVRNTIVHHGARTGRPTGEGAQPLNMLRTGPKLLTCDHCHKPFKPAHDACPWCAAPLPKKLKALWTPAMVDAVLEIMAYRSLDLVEYFFGDALLCVGGCSRGLFCAGEGKQLVASDYSAIEAVVTAELAGETWRKEAFHNRVPIYLASAAKITGHTVEWYEDYSRENGEHHPDRQNIGKVAELALGFGGWIGAWRNFDETDTFDDQQVKDLIKAWRAASPAIVELWGGQWRGPPWRGYAESFGLEGAAIEAVQNPDRWVRPRLRQMLPGGELGDWRTDTPDIHFMHETATDRLLIRLPSGRHLTYWEPRLAPSDREYASPGELSLSYMTDNTNPNYGAIGWVRMSTFGGRLCENVVQAVAHCLLRFAMRELRREGFDVVLHVYDEIVVEISWLPASPPGVPDPIVARVEEIMSRVNTWAQGWPVRAADGWRGHRYRKG